MHSAIWVGIPIININHMLYSKNCKYMLTSSVHWNTDSITNLYTVLPQYSLKGSSIKHVRGTPQTNNFQYIACCIIWPYTNIIDTRNQTSDTNISVIASLPITCFLSASWDFSKALDSRSEASGTANKSAICDKVSMLGVTSALSPLDTALSL